MGVGERDATDYVYIPSRKLYYLYIQEASFESLICRWLKFLYCYFGQARDGDSHFAPIVAENDTQCSTLTFSGSITPPRQPKRRRTDNDSAGSPQVSITRPRIANNYIGEDTSDYPIYKQQGNCSEREDSDIDDGVDFSDTFKSIVN